MFVGDSNRLREFLWQGFTALDIAEPLLSFDGETAFETASRYLTEQGGAVAGVRVGGHVAGFLDVAQARSGPCSESLQPFHPEQVLAADSPLINALQCADRHSRCFLTTLGEVVAIITPEDFDKPPARMWLFGMVTVVEMKLSRAIRTRFPDGAWRNLLPAGRLEKALALQAEKARRSGQAADLLTCLQLSDKGQIFMKDPVLRGLTVHPSRSSGERAFSALESLRNDLAHAEGLIPQHWPTITILASRMDRLIDFLKSEDEADRTIPPSKGE